MKTDKKQTVQLAVLGVLVVICIGYLSFSLMAPKRTSKHPASKSETKVKDSAESDRNPLDGSHACISSELYGESTDSGLGELSVRRDPFAPQKLPPGENAAAAPATTSSPKSVSKILNNIKNSMARVPQIDLRPLNPFQQRSETTRAQPVREEKPEQEEDIVLTGIVRGEQNVAIIRIGNTGRYIVKEGQTIDGRYQVASVTGDGAVLVYKNRHIPVRLGGSKNAK
ncbi:MAG: hypothetical protein N3B12_00405 [Armatimonadetes bacterium]|nr:hypothetical protein [Armatimonadota bacterium]